MTGRSFTRCHGGTMVLTTAEVHQRAERWEKVRAGPDRRAAVFLGLPRHISALVPLCVPDRGVTPEDHTRRRVRSPGAPEPGPFNLVSDAWQSEGKRLGDGPAVREAQ